MKLSQRAESIAPSLTRKLFNQAKQYEDVIDLTLGDPDFNTPEYIKDAGIKAIKDNLSHYSMNAGMAEARSAVAQKVKCTWGIDVNPDENVILTVGGMEALYLALQSIVDPGDEVIIFAPYYVNYYQMIQMCGGTPIVVNGYCVEKGMYIDADILEKAISSKTKAIILNSPNNPTGGILPRESLYSAFMLAEKHDLIIISDEVYRTLVYDQNHHESILQFVGAEHRTILVDSLSKEFCMTGWRIGYACGPKEIIAAMIKMQENVVACANVPAQYALIEAYRTNANDEEMRSIRNEFQKRRDYLCDALSAVKGLRFVRPQSTFYLFVDISDLGIKSEAFTYRLLNEKHVAVVPGKAYGYDDYIRIAFTKRIDVLENAVQRIRDFLQK